MINMAAEMHKVSDGTQTTEGVCSMISDGAAALVLSVPDASKNAKKAVMLRTTMQVNDFLPISRRDIISFEGPKVAWARALGRPNRF